MLLIIISVVVKAIFTVRNKAPFILAKSAR